MTSLKHIWNRLDFRLTILVLLLSVLPLIILGVFALESSLETLEQQKFNHLNAVTLLKADEINRWTENNVQHLNALAQRPLVSEYANVLTAADTAVPVSQTTRSILLANHLLPTLTDEGGFWELFLLDVKDGQVLVSTDASSEGKFRSDEPYFSAGQEGPYVQNVYYSLSLGQPAMTVSTPVRNSAGEVVAVLAGHLDLTALTAIAEQTNELTNTEDTFLVNRFNFFITNPRFGENYALQEATYTTGVTQCLRQENGHGVYQDYRGATVLGAYRWMPQRELCVVTEIDQTEALGAINTVRRSLSVVGMLVLTGIVTSGLFFTRSITRPLNRLMKGAKRIGQGNLEYQIPVQGQDEIGQLTAAFNRMADNLRHSIGKNVHGQELLLTLSRAAQAMQQARTPKEVYAAMGAEMARLDFDISVMLLTEDGKHVYVEYMSFDTSVVRAVEKLTGLSANTYRFPLPSGGYYEQIIKGGETIFISPMGDFIAEAMPKTLHFLANRVATMLGMEQGIIAPLIVDDEALGVLTVTGDNLTKTDVTAVSTFASQTAIALQNAQSIAQLQQNEARFRAIFEHAGMGIARVDIEGKPLESNPALQAMLGYDAEELRNMSFTKFTHPEDAEIDLALYQSLIAGERDVYDIDKRYINKNGDLVWARLTVSLVRDAQGKPEFAIGMVQDITDRKQAQEELERYQESLEEMVAARTAELQQSEARYRTLAESSPDMIFLINPDLTIEYVNRVAASQFGKEAAAVVGQPHTTLFPPEIAARQQQALQHVLTSGETVQAESKVKFPYSDVWLHTRLVPIAADGNGITAALGISRDITSLKEAELALEKKATDLERSNKELEQFAYVASHDLQEPLRMVTSYMQLMQRRYQGQLDEKADRYIDFAVDGANRMKVLIDDLLTYSRVGTRGKPFAPVSVETVLQHVLRDLEVSIEDANADISHDPLPTIMADGNQLGQLFQNLIGNAIKFRGETQPQIHIGVEKRDDMWHFCVQDNGIGFDPQFAERIFVIFQRLHTRNNYGGTGIGLAICKKIVERHGGEIWAESQPGAGAIFYFTIPVNYHEQENDSPVTD